MTKIMQPFSPAQNKNGVLLFFFFNDFIYLFVATRVFVTVRRFSLVVVSRGATL